MKFSCSASAVFEKVCHVTARAVQFAKQKKDALMESPAVGNALIRCARPAVGLLWVCGDMGIASGHKFLETAVGVGLFLPTSILFLIDPLLPRDENDRSYIPVGKKKIDAVKLGYNLTAVGCTAMFMSAGENLWLTHDPWEIPKMATAFSAIGSFEAGMEEGPESALKADEPFGKQLRNDNEFKGTKKFLLENSLAIAGAAVLGQEALVVGYSLYSTGVLTAMARRRVELKRQYKKLQTQTTEQTNAGVVSLPVPDPK